MLNYDLLSGRPGFRGFWSVEGILVVLLVLILISEANATCSISGGCGSNSGDWESSANAFLNSDVPGSFIHVNSMKANVSGEVISNKATIMKALNNTTATSIESRGMGRVSPPTRPDEFVNGGILKPLLGVSSSDVVIDVSNGNNYSERPHIKGAIHLPSRSFTYENGTLQPASELARILGNAGISRGDRTAIYGGDIASADATFVFWVMRYLGDDNVQVMDGGLDDWITASLPLESRPNVRKPAAYEPKTRQELLADYNYVKGGKAQLVDARTFQEFGKERITGSISIDSAHLLDNGKIKDAAQLNGTFSSLSKNKPVVVYSEDVLNASLVWYALQLMGYDSRLYTWKDWLAHRSTDGGKVSATKASSGAAVIDTSKYKKLGR